MQNETTKDTMDYSYLNEKVWDELTKKMAQKMPAQFLPLFNDQFGKHYDSKTKITTVSTESITPPQDENHRMRRILSDIVFLVENKDLFHVECEISLNNEMVIRMIEYDFHTALTHNLTTDETITVEMPKSIILYPGNNKSVPDSQSCTVRFADGHEHEYSVPVVRIQDYSLDDIEDKNLMLFLPFVLLRFRPRLTSKRNPLTSNELTSFVKQLILLLEKQVKHGQMSPLEYKDFIQLIEYSTDRVFIHEPNHKEEVYSMIESVLVLPSDIVEAKLAEQEATIAEKDSALAEKDNQILSLEEEVARLRAELAKKNS